MAAVYGDFRDALSRVRMLHRYLITPIFAVGNMLVKIVFCAQSAAVRNSFWI